MLKKTSHSVPQAVPPFIFEQLYSIIFNLDKHCSQDTTRMRVFHVLMVYTMESLGKQTARKRKIKFDPVELEVQKR